MIGHIENGSDFGGLFRYLLSPDKGARIIGGLAAGRNSSELTQEFNNCADLRRTTKKPVKHLIISFAPKDGFVTDEAKNRIAKSAVRQLGYARNQYVVIDHHRNDPGHDWDHHHDHIHIAVNAIDLTGKRTGDRKDKRRFEKILKELEVEFGLVQTMPSEARKFKASSHGQIQRIKRELKEHRQGLHNEPLKMPVMIELQAAIDLASKDKPTLTLFIARLHSLDIDVRPYISDKGRKRISYCYKDFKVRGCKLHNASFPKLISQRGIDFDLARDLPAMEAACLQQQVVVEDSQATVEWSQIDFLKYFPDSLKKEISRTFNSPSLKSQPEPLDDKQQEELERKRQGKETLEEVRVPTESVINLDKPKPIPDNSKVTAAKEAVSSQPERKQPKPHQAELPDSTLRALQSRLDTLNNRIELDRQLAEFSVVKSNSYLKSLEIETATLLDARFLKTIKTDGNGMLIFRHQNQEKTTGYQSIAKNVNRFSEDGTKSLWQSNFTEYDRHLIIVESPIDAIVHYQLHRQAQTRYIAFGDRPNPQQLEFASDMVRSFIRQKGTVTVATNNDSVGEQIFESISSKFSLDLVGRAKPKKQTWIGDVLEKQKQKLSQENKDSQNEQPNRFDKYLIGYIKTNQQSSSKKQNLLEGNGNSQEGNG